MNYCIYCKLHCFLGIEKFEEKVNKEENEEEYTEGETWTKKLLRDFTQYKTELEKEMVEENVSSKSVSNDLEPPNLDPTWGLQVQSSALGDILSQV